MAYIYSSCSQNLNINETGSAGVQKTRRVKQITNRKWLSGEKGIFSSGTCLACCKWVYMHKMEFFWSIKLHHKTFWNKMSKISEWKFCSLMNWNRMYCTSTSLESFHGVRLVLTLFWWCTSGVKRYLTLGSAFHSNKICRSFVCDLNTRHSRAFPKSPILSSTLTQKRSLLLKESVRKKLDSTFAEKQSRESRGLIEEAL